MSKDVFLIKDDESLTEMNMSPYISEEQLQNYIGMHPKLMTNVLDESGQEKWMLIQQEMRVMDGENSTQRWPVDHLFISNDGVPIFVEVKRSTDPRIRREVVGQMLDYAANGVAYWPISLIQEKLKARFNKMGKDFNKEFESFIGEEENPDKFWDKVKTNMQLGNIKMIFVADSIPKELKRIIEFLNQQMKPAIVLGVEIVKYTNSSENILVPRVIGYTGEAELRKTEGSLTETEPREGLQEASDEFNKKYSPNYISVGNKAHYRQIRLHGVTTKLHYEFMHTYKDGISVDFHIEGDGYDRLYDQLKLFVGKGIKVNQFNLIFDPKWSRGRGRLHAVIGNNQDPIVTAEAMKSLIDQTEKIIREYANDRQDQKIEISNL